MPTLNELDIEPNDSGAVLDAFRTLSRQVLYMALFDNEALNFSVFEETEEMPEPDEDFEEKAGRENETEEEEEGEGEGGEEDEDLEGDLDPEDIKRLRAFSHYLYEEMADDLPPPEELSVDEWAILAQEVLAEPDMKRLLPALASKVYRLLKQEIRLERERQNRPKSW